MPTCSEKSNQQLKMLEKNPRSLIVGPRNQEIQKGKSTKKDVWSWRSNDKQWSVWSI